MTKYTRRLKPEIIARLRAAAKRGDVPGFKRFLEDYAGELSLERTAQLIVEFKQYADALSAARRK